MLALCALPVVAGVYVANRVSDKLAQLHDTIWACRSGSAADTQALSDYVRYYLDAHRLELVAAAVVAERVCWSEKISPPLPLLLDLVVPVLLLVDRTAGSWRGLLACTRRRR